MTDAPLTLKTFFCEDPAAPVADGCELDLARKAVEEACAALPGPAREGAVKALAGALDEVFHVGLGEVLEASWGKLAGLQDALAATRADPAKVARVPLLDHKVTSKHAPYIDLMLGGRQLTRLTFDIVLTLALRGVQLDVRQGGLHGLTAGECQGEGTFSLGGQTLIKRSTPALALPGRLASTPAPAAAA